MYLKFKAVPGLIGVLETNPWVCIYLSSPLPLLLGWWFSASSLAQWCSLREHRFATSGTSWVKSETGPILREKGQTKEWGRLLQIGRFSKQRNLCMRLVLSGNKTSRSLYLPTGVKSLCRGLNWVCHIFCADGLNNTLLSQDCLLENGPTGGTVGRMYIPRPGEGMRNLWLPRSSSWVSQLSHPLDDLHHPNQVTVFLTKVAGWLLPLGPAQSPYLNSKAMTLDTLAFTNIHGIKPKWGSVTLEAKIFVSSVNLDTLTLILP